MLTCVPRINHNHLTAVRCEKQDITKKMSAKFQEGKLRVNNKLLQLALFQVNVETEKIKVIDRNSIKTDL